MGAMAAEAGGVAAAGAVAAAAGGVVHAASAAAGSSSIPADAWDAKFTVSEAAVDRLGAMRQEKDE